MCFGWFLYTFHAKLEYCIAGIFTRLHFCQFHHSPHSVKILSTIDYTTLAAVSLILRSFVRWLCSGWLPMALLSYFAILPWDLLDHSMLSQQTSAVIMEITSIAYQRGACLKLDDGMRANVHVCIHIYITLCLEKSCMLHPLLPWLDWSKLYAWWN